MIRNGFTWDYVRNQPLPPRSTPYTAKQITPDAERTKKAAAFKAHAYNSIATPAESDRTNRIKYVCI
jgi:hypothetical protein